MALALMSSPVQSAGARRLSAPRRLRGRMWGGISVVVSSARPTDETKRTDEATGRPFRAQVVAHVASLKTGRVQKGRKCSRRRERKERTEKKKIETIWFIFRNHSAFDVNRKGRANICRGFYLSWPIVMRFSPGRMHDFAAPALLRLLLAGEATAVARVRARHAFDLAEGAIEGRLAAVLAARLPWVERTGGAAGSGQRRNDGGENEDGCAWHFRGEGWRFCVPVARIAAEFI